MFTMQWMVRVTLVRLLEVSFVVWRLKIALTSRVYLWVVTMFLQDGRTQCYSFLGKMRNTRLTWLSQVLFLYVIGWKMCYLIGVLLIHIHMNYDIFYLKINNFTIVKPLAISRKLSKMPFPSKVVQPKGTIPWVQLP